MNGLSYLSAVAFAASLAGAQVPSALVVDGETLPGAFGITTSSIGAPSVNGVGGFVTSVAGPGGGSPTPVAHVWGSPFGRPKPKALVKADQVGVYEQTAFGPVSVDDVGRLAHVAWLDDLRTGESAASLWVAGAPVLITDDSVPGVAGQVWTSAEQITLTRDGTPVFLAGRGTSWQGTLSQSVYVGGVGAPVISTGDTPPSVPVAIESIERFAISVHGTRRMVEAVLPDDDAVLIFDGAGLVAGGLVKEGEPIRPQAGGLPGERWKEFEQFGCNDAGEWFLTAETFPSLGPSNEVLMRNGAITLREGDVVDGETLADEIHSAALNEDGDLAFVWDVASTGFAVGALFLEDRVLLRQGDPVDLDGDGVADTTLVDFLYTDGQRRIAISDRDEHGDVVIFFRARALKDGEPVFALFTLEVSAL